MKPTTAWKALFVFIALTISSQAQTPSGVDAAREMLKQGKFQQAISFLDSSTHASEKDPSLWLLLGSAYHCSGNTDKASGAFEKAADLEKCDTCHAALDSLGELYRWRDEAKADHYYEEGKKRGSPLARHRDVEKLIAEGCKHLMDREKDGALTAFREVTRFSNDTLAAPYFFLTYDLLGDESEAKAYSEGLQKLYPSFDGWKRYQCEKMIDSGLTAMSEGRYREALDKLQQAQSLSPGNNSGLVEMGSCYEKLGDTAQAFTCFSNAMFDSMSVSGASIGLAGIYQQRHQYQAALHFLTEAINIHPASIILWDSLGAFYRNLRYSDEAIECWKIMAKLGSERGITAMKRAGISFDNVGLGLFPWAKFDTTALRSTKAEAEYFTPVDFFPYPITQAVPEYPENARRAGVQGTVWVRLEISRAGTVVKWMVQKSDAEVFNEPSLEAGRKYRFAPAMMNGKPVAVWVSIPFRFKLNR